MNLNQNYVKTFARKLHNNDKRDGACLNDVFELPGNIFVAIYKTWLLTTS